MVQEVNEAAVQSFWNAHPCGDHIVGGLHGAFDDEYERFFTAYDARRYRQEGHIPACLDRTDWRDRKVLEIGPGQGAESEQLIRRGASWSGLDLAQESVDRVRARLAVRNLPYDDLRRGSALAIPCQAIPSTSSSATGCCITSRISTRPKARSTGCSSLGAGWSSCSMPEPR